MSLASFFSKLNNDVAKVAPLVDAVLAVAPAIVPSSASVVSIAEGVVKAAAAEGVALENDAETLWAGIQGAVTTLASAKSAA
jgi:hypothetical protein